MGTPTYGEAAGLISSKEAAQELLIRWAEVGGPPVVNTRREGFGTRLLQHASLEN